MTTAPLHLLQRWFVSVVTHDGPLEEALAAAELGPALGVTCGAELSRVLTAGSRLGPLERMAVYHGGYRARLVECLADDYPAVVHALGEDAFGDVASSYITRCPSRSPNLNAFGRFFPQHLEQQAGDAFLADLARLEWALVEAVHAEPGHSWQGDLTALPPEAWAGLRLAPQPSLRIILARYPVDAYYQAFRDDAAPPRPERAPSATAVVRRDDRVWRIRIEEATAPLLERLAGGMPLGEALAETEALLADAEGAPLSPDVVLRAFREWVRLGLFAGLASGVSSRDRG